MEATINFKIPEFRSIGITKKSFKELENAEDTFKSILNSFNKKLSKNWESIEFEFQGQTILVLKSWLEETNFNWQESHQIQ